MRETIQIIGVAVLSIILLIGVVWGAIKIFSYLPKPEQPIWICGQRVVDIELFCDDGYAGCSRKYILEDGSMSFLPDGAGKTNENGELCVRQTPNKE